MSNADKIRSMTMEQLSEFICKISNCENCKFCSTDGCRENREEWLESESDDQMVFPADMF